MIPRPILAALAAALALLLPRPCPAEATVRLAILAGKPAVTVRGSALVIRDGPAGEILQQGAAEKIVLRAGPDGILAPGWKVHPRAIELTARGPIRVDDRELGGTVEIRREADGLLVIDRLPMERYLEGVLNAEMGAGWPPEALKAQAVAARSFALRRCMDREGEAYDLTATSQDQAHKLAGAKDDRILRAIRETAGEVLTYGSLPAEALFFACCGGRTLSSQEVFGSQVAYLVPVEDPDCAACPSASWVARIPQEEVLQRLAQSGRFPEGRKLEPVERGLMVSGEGGRSLLLSRPEIRTLLGGGKVPGNRFKMEIEGGELVLCGSGHGHGVGMCQWGARGMAERGLDHQAILKRFYPATELRRAY